MAYIYSMIIEFKETSVFTKTIVNLMSDEQYRQLQAALINNPKTGDVMKGSGGIRKMRWGLEGRGKRGGTRIIYYIETEDELIFMLYAYPKNEQENLTPEQLKILKSLIQGTKK